MIDADDLHSASLSYSSPITQRHQYPPTYAAATDTQEDETAPPPPFSELTLPEDDGNVNKDADAAVSVREIMRTPSPTPTEARVLSEKTRTFDWKRLRQLLHWRRFTTKRVTLIAGVSIIAFTIVFLVYQSRIEDALLPFSDWLRDTPGAWVIPIAVMFVISFPPLFGHELVGFLCGDVWGVWLGFAIFAAGTVLGELGNFYAFKWFCGARGRKLEEKQLKYGLYAQVVREGGLKVPVIMRFSLIPSHFTTAIFSTCGMNVFIFLASAILSLPKQLAVVYIGVSQNNSGTRDSAKGIKAGVIIGTLIVTIFAMRYINKKVDEVKHRVVYARRKARYVLLFPFHRV
ncbi:hypothetical protein L226DRAFT_471368 [Lentinus tigrinus ALCF2SS1-7]|uniref:uncharacterized protein n=1 Tax=Lentinus tigrinus ALCF2SS1-7 TaxID=1328758 RepID=UPI0011661BBF|nr:hypothetical protein L226DRAFT_471368 [Lentinus tigrinus ALCF2SS1-7]